MKDWLLEHFEHVIIAALVLLITALCLWVPGFFDAVYRIVECGIPNVQCVRLVQ